MASVTIKHERFLPGMEVAAYPLGAVDVARRIGGVPGLAPTASATVGTDSALTITTAAAGTFALMTVTDERQTITVDATGGKFTATFGDQTTAEVAYNVSAANLKTALVALSNIGADDVAVTGGPGDSGGTTPYVVRFTGVLAGTDVAELTAATGADPLTGGASTVVVGTTVAGTHSTPNYVIAKTA